jgi:hypothetical protein
MNNDYTFTLIESNSHMYSHNQSNIVDIRTIRHEALGMPGRLGSNLAKLRQVVLRYLVPGQMQHGVLQGAGVTVAQYEAIAINPGRILARVLHDFTPQ